MNSNKIRTFKSKNGRCALFKRKTFPKTLTENKRQNETKK